MSTNKETAVLQLSEEDKRLYHWTVERIGLFGDPNHYCLDKYVVIEKKNEWTAHFIIDIENFWHGIFVAYLASINNLSIEEEFIIPENATFQYDLCFPQTYHRMTILNAIRDGDLIRTNIAFP